MKRLTQKDEQGNWCLKGVSWEQLHEGQVITKPLRERLYGTLWKLMEYEDTGLAPEEIKALNANGKTSEHRWIPVEERLPKLGEPVWATVKHSKWISDYDADWLPEEKKTYHPESYGVYKAEYIGEGIWQYSDDYNEWVYCDPVEKEKRNLANVYDTVTAWQPLPEPYRPEE